jgi:hypothetical protein
MRLVLGLALLLSVLGCVGRLPPPQWVEGGVPEDYPAQVWLSAIGTGETLPAARMAAKGELSRVFSAELESEIELIDRDHTMAGESTQSSELLDRTRIHSALELQGVEVPLHWRDSRTGLVWALAVLEREKECLRIRAEGQDVSTELAALVRESRNPTHPLVATRAAVRAVGLGVRLDLLQARSRVLGVVCLGPRVASTGQLRSEAAGWRRNLSFAVRASLVDPTSGRPGDALPQLSEEIAARLSRLGFQVGPGRQDGWVVPVEARLRLLPVERDTDWVDYRFEGVVEVGASEDGEPALIVVEAMGSESHPTAATARLRARRAAERVLAQKLEQRLSEFLDDSSERAGDRSAYGQHPGR